MATKTKSSTKPATKKATTKKAEPAAKIEAKADNGLTDRQVAVLQTLKSGKEMTRVELAAKTGHAKGWSKLLSSATKEIKCTLMEGMGFVKSAKQEGSRTITYTITAKGTKALAAK